MRLVDRRAARWRGLANTAVIVLCLASTLADVRAQDAAPIGGPAVIASAGEAVLLRERPGYDATVLAPLTDGGALDAAGEPVVAADGSSWLPVVAGGQSGYVPAGYVTVAPASLSVAPATVPAVAADPAAPASAPGGATTTTDANLRSGPTADSAVLLVLPPGTSVSVDGAASNGFAPVTGWGVTGWIAAELLVEGIVSTVPPPGPDPGTAPVPGNVAEPSTAAATLPAPEPATTTVAEPPNDAPAAASSETTGISWPFAGGEWEVVQGYNNGTHTNRSGFAQYQYSLDWARVDGDSAGQPVFAPVSGTVRWVDRGSGGMLVDAGNGYGVAVFHATIDRELIRGGRVARGQRIGTISGPGGEGYMSMSHIDITCWRLTDGGQEAVPFVGPNAIAGREFPDTGGANQHMGTTVTP